MSDVTIFPIIDAFIKEEASDLYLTVDAAPMLRTEKGLKNIGTQPLTEPDVRVLLSQLLSEEVIDEFDSTLEYNTALNWNNEARLRINVFRQRQHTGVVIRRIQTKIPTIKDLHLPKAYGDLALEKRGLVLIVGPTGSGKSTSMAAMIENRNEKAAGHIVTIEDPVEFIHDHKQCIITQRDVGIDTYSYGIALKNALRQRPDVIVIGEIRDRDTMEHAIVFSETGHLCLATLHANNANQAIERIINFFPEEKHRQILLSLSLNLRGVLSQRLVFDTRGSRALACEIMLCQGVIKNLIQEGKIKELKEHIERGRDQGMITFDQCLFDMFAAGEITEEVALAEADNASNLRLLIKQKDMSKRLSMDATATAAAKRSEF